MGFIREAMHANGIYTESDVKPIREWCETLWRTLVDLKCATEVRVEVINNENDKIRKKTDEFQDEVVVINTQCGSLRMSYNAADYVLDAFSKNRPY